MDNKKYIELRSGENLQLTVQKYDDDRPRYRHRTLQGLLSNPFKRKLRPFCYAPFLSMDFDATGAIRLCNHSHRPVGNVTEETSVLDVWRGEVYRRYRTEMQDYILDEDNCRHCIRQCETGCSKNVFAVAQFDRWAHNKAMPRYPKVLIFRLNNTCNLACVMCDGLTS
jgi:radical SAM protein with 4Fe4S-binding SPASM domain